MDTEKLKQMGRDYFKANPMDKIHCTDDAALMAEIKAEPRAVTDIIEAWDAGVNEARYAASKEGRAIELLRELVRCWDEDDSLAYTWDALPSARAFLAQVG